MKSNTFYYKFVLVLFLVCAPNLLAISLERKHRHRRQHEKLLKENVSNLKIENQSKTGKLDKKHFKVEFKLSLSAAQFASSLAGDGGLNKQYKDFTKEAASGSGDSQQAAKATALTQINSIGIAWTVTGAYAGGNDEITSDELDVNLVDQSKCATDSCGEASRDRTPKRSFSGASLMGDDLEWSQDSEDESKPLLGGEEYRFKWSSALSVTPTDPMAVIKALLALALVYLIKAIIKQLLIEVAKEVAQAVVAAVLPVAGWVLFAGKLIDWIYKVSKLTVTITKEIKDGVFKKHSVYTFGVSYPLSFIVDGLSIGMSVTMSLRKGKKFIAEVCLKSVEANSTIKKWMDPVTAIATDLVNYVLDKIKNLWGKWYTSYKQTKYQKLDDEHELIKQLSFEDRTGSKKLFKHRKSKKRMSKA